MQVNVNQSSGVSVDEIAQAFVKIMKIVNTLPEGTKKEDAYAAARKLGGGARKGEQVDRGNVQGWFSFIAAASAGAWEVALDALANPVECIGTAVRKISERAKEERRRS